MVVFKDSKRAPAEASLSLWEFGAHQGLATLLRLLKALTPLLLPRGVDDDARARSGGNFKLEGHSSLTRAARAACLAHPPIPAGAVSRGIEGNGTRCVRIAISSKLLDGGVEGIIHDPEGYNIRAARQSERPLEEAVVRRAARDAEPATWPNSPDGIRI
jgi:hypothetical protein